MHTAIRTIAFSTLFTLLATGVTAETVILAPGYGELEYDPPAPGTYTLPVLGDAIDGKVIDRHGNETTLHEIMDGQLVLMGFIYTHCPDVNGCPLASYVMKQVQAKLVEDEQLRDQVTLISLSFDPELDTPDAMMQYSHHFKRKDFDWRFLTTKSEEDLQPILDGYGQFRAKYYSEDGSYSGSMSHVLRVYLIDRDKKIRNIYSAGFLHVDTVEQDFETVALE
ncbi:MAG: SCO family protein [Halieaceae bacterium]|jgi:cytochrome c peroxidase|nr:SCO family protein [Halieaceae bacterium]